MLLLLVQGGDPGRQRVRLRGRLGRRGTPAPAHAHDADARHQRADGARARPRGAHHAAHAQRSLGRCRQDYNVLIEYYLCSGVVLHRLNRPDPYTFQPVDLEIYLIIEKPFNNNE